MSRSYVFPDEKFCKEVESRVERYMSPSRFRHTVGVAQTAVKIASYIDNKLVTDAYLAGMLHDVAKELDTEIQIKLIKEYSVKVDKEALSTVPALHSFAAVAVVKRDFPEFATDAILSAIYNHTLGAPDMNVLDKIIYISDYVEPSRVASACVSVRDYLFGALELRSNDPITVLNKSIVMAIDFTSEYLESIGNKVNSVSIKTKEILETLV